MDFIKMCFSTDFMPHGHCYYWQPEILWPHVIGDALTAIAYFMIPFLLLRFARKRPDIKEYYWFFYAFSAFILCCGITHVLAVISVWSPYYRLEAVTKVITAIVSLGTVGVLYVKFPLLLTIPTSQNMRTARKKLDLATEKQQQISNQLRNSEERLKNTIQEAAIGMALVSPQGVLLDANRSLCEMLGYTNEELTKMDFQSITHPDDLLADTASFEQLWAGEIYKYHMEKRYIHKDGHIVWGDLNVSLLRGDDGQPIYTIGQVIDITETKKQAKEIELLNESLEVKVQQRTAELADLNREMEDYTYTITHDLRQPLRNLSGLSEEIVTEYAQALDEDGKYMLYLIKQNAEKMDTLLTDLMSFAKAKVEELTIKKIDFNTLFKESIDSQRQEYPHHELVYNIGNLPNGYGDRTALGQVVQNLVSNALKYSSKSNNIEITISGWHTLDQVIYQISDNGVGFDENQSEKLFAIFKRLHAESDFQGTGLGLAMCQRIIKKHGGEMWAKSKKGQGASFFFSLPRQEEQNASAIGE